jgi:flagellar motor switch protein FliG
LQDFIDQAQMHSTLALDSHEYIRSVLNKALGEAAQPRHTEAPLATYACSK